MAIALLAASADAAAGGPLAAAARVGATPAATQLQLVLPLKANVGGLRALALAVSTPGNRRYGQYESIPQLARRFGARRSVQRRALAYLRRAGATALKLDATGLFIDATLRAASAERLFATTLTEFRTRQGRFTAPSAGVSIPPALRGLVTGVVGLDTRPVAVSPSPFRTAHAVRAQIAARGASWRTSAFAPIARAAQAPPSSAYKPVSGTQSGCPAAEATSAFTPNQYLTAYNYTPLQAAGITGQGERVALIEIDGFKQSDIKAYANCFGLHLPPIKAFGVGINRALAPGGETTLDLEVMAAAAPGVKEIDVYESDADETDSLKALTAPLQNKDFKPQVISASLGLCEPFVYGAVGRSAVRNTEGALEEAAAAGISFLDSSGDSGSADCTDNSGAPIDRLAVNYPTSSWWVTGVGGTNIALNTANQLTGEVVWNDGLLQPGSAGGGGRSLLFNRPPYQKGTVVPNVRAVPDVSMLADIAPGYAIYCSVAQVCVDNANPDPWQPVGGTSAATPLLSGGFLMIDQYLREHQHEDLGLANPLLYDIGRSAQAASVFHDVTEFGNDVGPFISSSGAPLGCCTAGVGYDDASGWGSINLAGLAAAALASAPPIANVSMTLPGHQHPVAAHGIKTDVTCSSQCLLGSYAVITIGHAKSFQVFSKLYPMNSGGTKAVKIGFSGGEESKLRAGLRAGSRIEAAVVGAVVDAGGHIERHSPTRTIRITG
jgi:kumamolisin